jgi:hypothetical protein
VPKPYDRTTYGGKTVDWLTRAALEETAKRLGYLDGLTITQGSYNAGGVSASAGTHDGGGVVDLSAYEHARKVRELRRTGFAAWYRPAISGLWPAHIHAVLIGNKRLAPVARRQVDAYLAGRDGLAGNGPDNGPRDFVDRRFRWRKGEQRINRAADLIARARAVLSEGIRGYPGVAKVRKSLGAAARDLPRTRS